MIYVTGLMYLKGICNWHNYFNMTGCQLNFMPWRTREKLWDTYGVYSLYFKPLLFTEKFRNFFTDLRFLVCEFTVKLLDIRLLLSKFFVHFSLKFRFLLINGFRTIFFKNFIHVYFIFENISWQYYRCFIADEFVF